MAFHKSYRVGETYHHTAARENDISNVLNQLAGLGVGEIKASNSGIVRVSCYNNDSDEIPAGSAVMFSDSGSLCGDSIPVRKYDDSNYGKLFAVLETTLGKGKIGNAIIAGAAKVNVSGEKLDYVIPDILNPGKFKYSATGTARVLFSNSEIAFVLLGSVSNNDSYNGPFSLKYDKEEKKIRVSPGYLRRNGDFVTVSEKELFPDEGVICVTSRLENGTWTEPEIVFAVPDASHYPIGKCTLKDDGAVVLDSFYVAVAVILDTGPCPLIQMAGS